jgi:hypothetical protein
MRMSQVQNTIPADVEQIALPNKEVDMNTSGEKNLLRRVQLDQDSLGDTVHDIVNGGKRRMCENCKGSVLVSLPACPCYDSTQTEHSSEPCRQAPSGMLDDTPKMLDDTEETFLNLLDAESIPTLLHDLAACSRAFISVNEDLFKRVIEKLDEHEVLAWPLACAGAFNVTAEKIKVIK